MKLKIGIPRSLHYYTYGWMWIQFFEELGCEVIVSPKTNREILNAGMKYANDEMCLPLKEMIGHVWYLKDKVDYVLIPRIDNYGREDQTCTNFLAVYDIVNNLFDVSILNYNIDYVHRETTLKGFYKMGQDLGFEKYHIKEAYYLARYKVNKLLKKIRMENQIKLNSDRKKILIVSHAYNLYDELIGQPILDMLKGYDVEVLCCDKFNPVVTSPLSCGFTSTLYWKFNKENIGAIKLVETKIAGVIFLSSFPCGPDSLVNELVMRRTNLPCLNLIVDDLDAMAGIETRIESFIDILYAKEY